MKGSCKILFVLFGALFLFASCNKVSWSSRRIQRTLHEQQRHAEELTQHLCNAIKTNNFDSLWSYSHVDENIVFYIYYGDKMVFWSNSWLTSSSRIKRSIYDQWYFTQWDNAQGICYKTKVGEFHILVAIPIKYNYSITSDQLHNSFIPPFRANESMLLSFYQAENSAPIYSADGNYLFSINIPPSNQNTDSYVHLNEVLDNFSYRSIFSSGDTTKTSSYKLNVYYGLIFVLIIMLLGIAIYSLIRYKGFKRMRMVGKFQIVLTPTVLVILLSIFLASIEKSRRVFIDTQQLRLSKKMTQGSLAKKLGVSVSTIGMYERGQRNPDNEMLIKISKAFSVSVDTLLGVRELSHDATDIMTEMKDKIMGSKELLLYGVPLNDEDRERLLNAIEVATRVMLAEKEKRDSEN
jgi:transcriptional regulator with XRE-family HTH domain